MMDEREIDYEKVLVQRAEKLARDNDRILEEEVQETIAVVRVASQKLGIPTTGLLEIVKTPEISALRGLPPWLPGLVQVGGELICAVDLPLLRGSAEDGSSGAFLAVLDGKEGRLGLLVDQVLGFRDIHARDLANRSSEKGGGNRNPFRAVTTDLVSILDLERFFDIDAITVDHSVETQRSDNE